jgi:hypothetical protein
MRRYDVVSGILLILYIIDFALAAPVLVQEKRQAFVDVVHIPKDLMTVLGKRGNEELEKLLEGYFNEIGKPVESSDAHASSSSAPLGPDHGSTNVVQEPEPNPHLPLKTSKPPILDSSDVHASSSSGPNPHLPGKYLYFKTWNPPMIHELSEVHAPSSSSPPGSDHGSTVVVQAPEPSPHLPEKYMYFKTWKPPMIHESSEVHVSSSSAPPGSEHGLTNMVQAPKPKKSRRPYRKWKPPILELSSGPHPHLPENYFKTWNTPVILDSSKVPASSSSAPPGSDHGSTDAVQAPAPNPASSTANPDPLMEPSGTSSVAPMQGSWEDRFINNPAWNDVFSNKGNDELQRMLHAVGLSDDYDPDHEWTGAHSPPQPNPDKGR